MAFSSGLQYDASGPLTQEKFGLYAYKQFVASLASKEPEAIEPNDLEQDALSTTGDITLPIDATPVPLADPLPVELPIDATPAPYASPVELPTDAIPVPADSPPVLDIALHEDHVLQEALKTEDIENNLRRAEAERTFSNYVIQDVSTDRIPPNYALSDAGGGGDCLYRSLLKVFFQSFFFFNLFHSQTTLYGIYVLSMTGILFLGLERKMHTGFSPPTNQIHFNLLHAP